MTQLILTLKTDQEQIESLNTQEGINAITQAVGELLEDLVSTLADEAEKSQQWQEFERRINSLAYWFDEESPYGRKAKDMKEIVDYLYQKQANHPKKTLSQWFSINTFKPQIED